MDQTFHFWNNSISNNNSRRFLLTFANGSPLWSRCILSWCHWWSFLTARCCVVLGVVHRDSCLTCVCSYRYEMLRAEDGSIRGTVKMIENIKLHNMQKDADSKHRGDGACFYLTSSSSWICNLFYLFLSEPSFIYTGVILYTLSVSSLNIILILSLFPTIYKYICALSFKIWRYMLKIYVSY